MALRCRWQRAGLLTCVLLLGATAYAALFAATHAPETEWMRDADAALTELERMSEHNPVARERAARLRARFDAIKRGSP